MCGRRAKALRRLVASCTSRIEPATLVRHPRTGMLQLVGGLRVHYRRAYRCWVARQAYVPWQTYRPKEAT